jgi:hypothetical protein
MIKGMHGMFYTGEADALRAFLRDKLQLPFKDVGGGWLIFDLPMAEIGVHPIDHQGAPPSGTHDLSFVTDDIEGSVASMRERGVVFSDAITDQGYGLAIHFEMPGGVKVELYQPKY